MFAHVTSATLVGVEARAVEVEAHLGKAQARFSLVGLPDTAVREAKQRVESALAASGFLFPNRRLTVNLAPADLPKAGSAFDLPIALGVLGADGQARGVEGVVAVGELALDGRVRPARGELAAALVAARRGRPCLLSAESAGAIAGLVDADLRPVADLKEAVAVLDGAAPSPPVPSGAEDPPVPDLADVRGQPMARRALELAAAGGHNLLMTGPPGAGKSMLARRLPGLLPDLVREELVEVACVYAAAGLPPPRRRPPFRSPHHSASVAALLGGGSGVAVPGELSLAHRGVLFLDELGEFPTNVLDALRQPLEDRRVTIARRGVSVAYPAGTILVAATNPCPCGYLGDRLVACRCSEAALGRHRRRLSGPLLDRFDISVWVGRPERLDGPREEPTGPVRRRVEAARSIQLGRGKLNCELDGWELDQLDYTPEARRLLAQAVATGSLTGRGYDRTRRLARTIADLSGGGPVDARAVAEAMALRKAG